MPDAASLDLRHPSKLPAESGPEGLLAVRLIEWAQIAGPRGLVYVARSETRAERLASAVRGLAPLLELVVLPPWDCLPYDRAGPSREVMGRRMSALRRLSDLPHIPHLLITTVDAAMQRLPPREVGRNSGLCVRVGEELRLDQLQEYLLRVGYRLDDRVDEPGEAAIRGEVADVFPAGAEAPYRLDHDDGRITGIRRYNPLTQRTTDEVHELRLDPASEVIVGDPMGRFPAIEHWLPQYYRSVETMFDYAPSAPIVLDPEVDDRRAGLLEQIADAYQSRLALRRTENDGEWHAPLAPDRFYLDEDEWQRQLQTRPVIELGGNPREAAVPRFFEMRDPVDAFGRYVTERLAADGRVFLAAGTPADLRRLARAAERELERRPQPFPDWDAAVAAAPGTVGTLVAELTGGFVYRDVTVIAAADIAGGHSRGSVQRSSPELLIAGELNLRLGDAVIHLDHGMGALRGLEMVQAGAQASEVIKLEYAAQSNLLAPIDEIGQIWRYGSQEAGVTLDRLDGEGWAKRRSTIEQQVAQTARGLLELARARENAAAPVLKPPRRDYARFAGRFPFTETPDQARAIEATLRDLASGKPMDRLVCGDVGFGKTEVALRAAAATVFAGKQVAVVAPTTVLVRQHLQIFRRRFAGLGVRIEPLSRFASPAEARAARKGLANGEVRIVIGTHAVAGKQVRFEELGLLVIDEEQRFGAKQKERLRNLGSGVHVLTLTATPIPRTMQAAMVGLQEVSVIATPPARRQPTRTFLLPFDPVTVREALWRERQRGGQSFVVCPHIDDIAPIEARLRELAPELDILSAHGRMPGPELDDVMLRFADGEGDVLLSTNIIEAGLDIAGANTILIWRPDRFGMAQLHQLRGRVGRGRVRGVCYLLTDPAGKIVPATERRLRSLETIDRLGAGFAISARDLDLRGAGDLIGDEQAGHIKLVGIELYQDLLQRALAVARGEHPPEEWTPELNFGLRAGIPASYVPEAEVRLNLYARLARIRGAHELDDFAAEIEDRFGEMPDEVSHLLALARLSQACRLLGVAKIDAGPQAIALTFRDRRSATGLELDERLSWRGERLLLDQPTADPERRLHEASRLLRSLSRGRRSGRDQAGDKAQ